MSSYGDTRAVAPVRWGAILTGAVLCLAVQVVLVLLGAGFGLTAIPWQQTKDVVAGEAEALRWTAIAFAGLSLAAAFFVGGAAASYLAGARRRGVALLHGLAVWGVVAVILVAFAAKLTATSVGTLLGHAGLGAGAASGAGTVLEQLGDMQLKVVTDLSILKGKAVSDLFVTRRDPDSRMVPKAVKHTKKELAAVKNRPDVREPVEHAAKTVTRTAGAASLASGGVFVFGALAAALGAWVGRRRRDDDPAGGTVQLRAA